jgi:hypothetical protein
MKLFDRAGIRMTDAGAAASVAFHDYVSDRSAALLLREQPGQLEIGSIVCVKNEDDFSQRLPHTTSGTWPSHSSRSFQQEIVAQKRFRFDEYYIPATGRTRISPVWSLILHNARELVYSSYPCVSLCP